MPLQLIKDQVPVFFRGPYIIVLTLMLWGVNVWVFSRFGIQWQSLLGIPRASALRPSQIFQLAMFIFIIITASFTLFLQADTINMDEDYFPAVCYLFIIYLMFCRQNVLFMKARMFFWKTVKKIMLPTHPIAFGEVFVADIFTTLSKVFADLEIMVCVTIAHFLGGDDHHNFTERKSLEVTGCMHSLVMPLVASIPYAWRARQCAVSYNATGEVVPHLVNLGKYLSAFPVVWTSFINKEYASEEYKPIVFRLWLLFVFVNTIYSFLWDVYMDWGLGNVKCGFLRHELVYKYRIFYYFIILFDLFARFTWSITLSQHIHLSLDEALLLFEIVEVVRRFFWNFLRVEWFMLVSSGRDSSRLEEMEMPFRRGSVDF